MTSMVKLLGLGLLTALDAAVPESIDLPIADSSASSARPPRARRSRRATRRVRWRAVEVGARTRAYDDQQSRVRDRANLTHTAAARRQW